MFEINEAFADFSSRFKTKDKNPTLALELFGQALGTDTRDHEPVYAAMLSRLTAPVFNSFTPETALKKVFGIRLASPPPAATASRTPQAVTRFDRLWDRRPRNVLGQPESKAEAKYCFDVAAKKLGADLVYDALTAFNVAEASREWPRHYSTVLGDLDLVKDYAEQYRFVPSESDLDLFRAAYSRYPGAATLSKEDEIAKSAVLKRVVPESELLRFFAAITAYSNSRDEEDGDDEDFERYTRKWSNFVTKWKDIECGHELAAIVADGFKDARVSVQAGTDADAMAKQAIRDANTSISAQRTLYDSLAPDRPPHLKYNLSSNPGTWDQAYKPKPNDRFLAAAEHDEHGCLKYCRCYCRGYKGASCHNGIGCGHRTDEGWVCRYGHGDKDSLNPEACRAYFHGCLACAAATATRGYGSPDCEQDPCMCGNRRSNDGHCGRPGCEGDLCACGAWVSDPGPELTVTADEVLERALKCVVETPIKVKVKEVIDPRLLREDF